jgi:hypothetical protein
MRGVLAVGCPSYFQHVPRRTLVSNFGKRRHVTGILETPDIVSCGPRAHASPTSAISSSPHTKAPVISWPPRELLHKLHLPKPTPSNNAIKSMHFHAYKKLLNGWRANVLAAIGGKLPAAPITTGALEIERYAPAAWTGITLTAT